MREHGTNSAYSSGCRCRRCKDAHNEYTRERRMGQFRRIPAEPYAKRLKALTLPRVTIGELSERSGVPEETLRQLRDVNKSVTLTVAKKLDPWLGEARPVWEDASA